ncbi:MAG: hypothetical protein KAH25_03640 [Bacteroidales bacterium]|nr:hypothetical protein [Bacteroidales bacterium]
MKKQFLLFLILNVFLGVLSAQNQPIEVVYHRQSKGEVDTSYTFKMQYFKGVSYFSKADDKIQNFIDYNRNVLVDIIKDDGTVYKSIEAFDSLPKPKFHDEIETILGYKCKKATYSSFSNTIEVWYSDKPNAKGSPYRAYGPKNSLVLKVSINGSRILIATEINKLPKETVLDYPFAEAKEITKAEYREIEIESRYTTFNVFDKAQINWGDSIVNPEPNQTEVLYRFAGGTVIMKKVKFPELCKQGAQTFVKLTNWSNGDAYDRTGSLFTISGKKDMTVLEAYYANSVDALPVFTDNNGDEYQGLISTEDYEVPVELMRFFTSFGVSHFNNMRPINNYDWQDSVVYKQEITALIPNDEGEIWIGVAIGNYDGGGHYVSLDLQVYPAWETSEVQTKYINPLFNTVNTMEMLGQNYGKMFGNDTLMVDFVLPENTEDISLLFTTTGHGGWGGGDEFNPKINQVFIDGEPVFNIVPWRSDCGTYRLSNPSSGNFANGLSSSDLSRSNWCPATLTPPYLVPLKDLKAGKHTISVVIDQGESDGGSFSAWCVTGVIVGNEKLEVESVDKE